MTSETENFLLSKREQAEMLRSMNDDKFRKNRNLQKFNQRNKKIEDAHVSSIQNFVKNYKKEEKNA